MTKTTTVIANTVSTRFFFSFFFFLLFVFSTRRQIIIYNIREEREWHLPVCVCARSKPYAYVLFGISGKCKHPINLCKWFTSTLHAGWMAIHIQYTYAVRTYASNKNKIKWIKSKSCWLLAECKQNGCTGGRTHILTLYTKAWKNTEWLSLLFPKHLSQW